MSIFSEFFKFEGYVKLFKFFGATVFPYYFTADRPRNFTRIISFFWRLPITFVVRGNVVSSISIPIWQQCVRCTIFFIFYGSHLPPKNYELYKAIDLNRGRFVKKNKKCCLRGKLVHKNKTDRLRSFLFLQIFKTITLNKC